MKLLLSLLLAISLVACAPSRPIDDISDMQEEVDMVQIPVESPYCDLYLGQNFPVINGETFHNVDNECRWDTDGPVVKSFIADGFGIELSNGNYVSVVVLKCPGPFGLPYRYGSSGSIRVSFIGRYLQPAKPIRNCVFNTNSVRVQKNGSVCYLVGNFNDDC